jgi:hypothetical protein
MADWVKEFKGVNRRILETGLTSYLPTVISSQSEVYKKVRIFMPLLLLGILWSLVGLSLERCGHSVLEDLTIPPHRIGDPFHIESSTTPEKQPI